MLHTVGTPGSENGSYTLMVPTHGHRRSQHAQPWSRSRVAPCLTATAGSELPSGSATMAG